MKHVAIAQQTENLAHRFAAQPQDFNPERFLHLMDGLNLSDRPKNRRFEILEDGSEIV